MICVLILKFLNDLEANLACKSFGGQTLLPTSEFHFEIIAREDARLIQTKELETMYNDCKTAAWYPVIKSDDLSELMDFDNRSKKIATHFHDFLPDWSVSNDGMGFQKCWIMDYKKRKLRDKDCSLAKSCINCVWPQKPILRLRGLCKKSYIEDHYTLVNGFNHNGILGKIIYVTVFS